MPNEPRYFKNAAALRAWFSRHAVTDAELIIGFMKTNTGVKSVTWPEAVDEALCVGWIDGVRRRIDADRYAIRFSPRKPGSTWSSVNIQRIAELDAAGRLKSGGRAAFAQRKESRSRTASYEQGSVPELSAAQTREFRKDPRAWGFYEALPPSYRKKVAWWVISAKQQSTRDHRLAQLMKACAAGKRL